MRGKARIAAAAVGEPSPGRAVGVGRRGRCSRASLDLSSSLPVAVLLELSRPFAGRLGSQEWAGVESGPVAPSGSGRGELRPCNV